MIKKLFYILVIGLFILNPISVFFNKGIDFSITKVRAEENMFLKTSIDTDEKTISVTVEANLDSLNLPENKTRSVVIHALYNESGEKINKTLIPIIENKKSNSLLFGNIILSEKGKNELKEDIKPDQLYKISIAIRDEEKVPGTSYAGEVKTSIQFFYAEPNPLYFKTKKEGDRTLTLVGTQEYKQIISNGVTPITPQTGSQSTNNSNGTYELLAPIGDFKDIETNNIGEYFNKIFLILIGLAGALAVIRIIIGGVQWMGTDSVFGKTQAKEQMTSALLGLLIALAAYAILNTINPALLGKDGLNIDQVNIELEEESIPWSTYSSGGSSELCPEGFIDIKDGGNGIINVCKTIADDLTRLIARAKEDGIILSGYGSRSTEQQRELRKTNNCPDIENSPSKDCKPPTARPGKSMHESGKAIDFKCNGKSMEASGGKNSPCFKWLSDKNNNTLLKNLKSEVWHWSTTGA